MLIELSKLIKILPGDTIGKYRSNQKAFGLYVP
jgi:hypothetical protein